jgi:hypothetical protein
MCKGATRSHARILALNATTKEQMSDLKHESGFKLP